MRLESARALKMEMKAMTQADRAPTTEALSRRAADVMPALAIGIAPVGRDDYRIAVRVREENARTARAVEQIAAAAKGEVDVRVTGPIVALPATTPRPARGVRIGMSVGHHASTAGTLGCFAVGTDGRSGFISNNHVLALEDAGVAGDDVMQPGPLDQGTRPDDVIAALAGGYPSLKGGRKTLDCAFARLLPNVSFDALDLGGSERLRPRVTTVEKRSEVGKVGRTTGRTSGEVSAFDIDNIIVDYPHSGISVTFDDQIEIESIGVNFAEPGDSGSLLFDEFFEPAGLVFATILSRRLTFANPLQPVLDALQVRLIT